MNSIREEEIRKAAKLAMKKMRDNIWGINILGVLLLLVLIISSAIR